MSKENRLDLGGSDLTDYLAKLLSQNKGYWFTSNKEKVRDVKEKCCYCALNYDKEVVKAQTTTDIQLERLPDGERITINESRFQCCEPLFNPQLIGIEDRSGVDQMIYDGHMDPV
eukprot:854350_1